MSFVTMKREPIRKAILGGLAALLLLGAAAGAQSWTFLGPAPIDNVQFTGRIASLATSASDPDEYVIAGASGGVWKTGDGGATWSGLTDNLPTLAMGAVAFDPNNENVIYAGSGESHQAYHSLYGLGLYKSTDGGQTWKVLAADTFAGRTFARIVVSPTGPVWAAISRAGGTFGDPLAAKFQPDRFGPVGIFRSDDGGKNWSQVGGGLPAERASDIELDPRDPNRIYVTISDNFGSPQNGIYLSTDGGTSWSRILPTADLGRTELAISPSDPDRLYALVTNPAARITSGGFFPPGSGTFGLYRSDDAGTNWTFSNPGNFQGGQGVYNSGVIVDPADPDTVFLAGVFMLRSRDGGATFQNVTPPHVDIHDLGYDAAGRLIATGDGGVFRSPDGGDTWENRNGLLGTVQFYPGIALDPRNPETILGGTQDNGTNFRIDGTLGWAFVLGGDGGYNAISPVDSNIVFFQFQGPGILFGTFDGGMSLFFLGFGIDFNDRSAFQTPYQIDPNNPQRLLYATHRIYESNDLGLSWTLISGDLTSGAPFAVRSLVIASSNSQTVYASTNDQRIMVSTDGGANWTLSREDVFGWPRVMRQIAVDPLDDAVAFAADARFGGDKVLRTKNRGQTWKAIGEDLPDVPVNTVAVRRIVGDGNDDDDDGSGDDDDGDDDDENRVIYAGTDLGIFVSYDGGDDWDKLGQGLPNVPVVDLVVDTINERLIAATLGRGIWSIPLTSDDDDD